MPEPTKNKIRPDVLKLLARRDPLDNKALEEFTKIKAEQGIDVKSSLKKGDAILSLELMRFQNKFRAEADKPWNNIPSDVKFERIDANGVPVEWIICPGASEHQIILYFFGGGYLFGDLDTRRWNPYLLGTATKLRVLNVGYRLAPENPFPAALEDAVTSYKWLLSNGFKSRNIIFSGASAGGALAVSTMLKLRELGISLPAAAILLSPYADLAFTGDSISTNSIFAPGFNIKMLRGMGNSYLQGTDPTNPYVSPIYADLKGLPPMLIQAGGIELFTSDAIRLADRAKEAGIDAKLEIWDDMPHVFQSFGDELPESKESIENIAEFIRKIL